MRRSVGFAAHGSDTKREREPAQCVTILQCRVIEASRSSLLKWRKGSQPVTPMLLGAKQSTMLSSGVLAHTSRRVHTYLQGSDRSARQQCPLGSDRFAFRGSRH